MSASIASQVNRIVSVHQQQLIVNGRMVGGIQIKRPSFKKEDRNW